MARMASHQSSETLTLSPAAMLYLKLAAFVLMIADHADWFLGTGQGAHATGGRLVFPIFALVLGYNMARTSPEKLLATVAPRLCLIGVVAQVPYVMLQGQAVPLNIMVTLAAAVAIYAAAEMGKGWHALAIGAFAGLFVDYSWPGLLGVLFIAWACSERIEWRVLAALLAMALLLTPINGNAWACLAVPVVWLVSRSPHGDAPRLKWLFWIGYPVHLVILLAIKLAS